MDKGAEYIEIYTLYFSSRDRTWRDKAAKSLMNEGLREPKRTCPLCSIKVIKLSIATVHIFCYNLSIYENESSGLVNYP